MTHYHWRYARRDMALDGLDGPLHRRPPATRRPAVRRMDPADGGARLAEFPAGKRMAQYLDRATGMLSWPCRAGGCTAAVELPVEALCALLSWQERERHRGVGRALSVLHDIQYCEHHRAHDTTGQQDLFPKSAARV